MSRLFDDGNQDYLEVLSVPLTAGPLTMAAWYYTDDLTTDQVLICLGSDPGTTLFVTLFLVGSAGNDPVRMAAYDGVTSMIATTSAAYSTGVWQHAAGVLNADGSGKSWINGGNAGIDTTGPNVIDAVAKTNIGRRRYGDTSDKYMSGRIAEVAIWNAALTDADVAALAAGFTPNQVRPGSLVFYVPLIRDDDEDIVGGLSLNAGGAPTIARHPPIARAYSPSFYAAPVVPPPPIDRSGHGPDALRLEDLEGRTLQMLRIGTVPGVAIDHVAALNAAATGTIRIEADGRTISYKAPDSSAYGTPVVVPPAQDVTDILQDGDDPDQFLRVSVDADELPSGQVEGRTTFRRRYLHEYDVTAYQAQAGHVKYLYFEMENASAFVLSNLRVWIDPSVDWLEISETGFAPWFSPTTEVTALLFPDLAVGGTDNLCVKRIIPAVTDFDPAVPWWLHFSFDGGP